MNAMSLLEKPPVEWEERLSALTQDQRRVIEDDLAAMIQRATLLHEYVSHRWNTGCGDQGHAKSAKSARRALIGVRRVLGYSYPKATPLSL